MPHPGGRDLHSSIFRLNVSAFCEIGGAFRSCLRGLQQVAADIRGCLGCALCQKGLRLNHKVDECKPLPGGSARATAAAAAVAVEDVRCTVPPWFELHLAPGTYTRSLSCST